MVTNGWTSTLALHGPANGHQISPGPRSVSSSTTTSTFEDGGILNDLEHFEEIGLDDVSPQVSVQKTRGRPPPASVRPLALGNGTRKIQERSASLSARDLTTKAKTLPQLSTNIPTPPASVKEAMLNLPNSGGRYPSPNRSPSRASPNRPGPPSPAASVASVTSLPNSGPSSKNYKPRGSWQGTRKKTIEEIEKECDDDSDDDIPDNTIFWNIPISPRIGRGNSISASPERYRKMLHTDNPTPVNSRPPTRGSSMTNLPVHSLSTRGRSQVRAKSWNDAIHELGHEAKELTEALERHADEEKEETANRLEANNTLKPAKPKDRPHTITLPPVQVSNGMIDPLPISKEKAEVLSRTRPSWLPPKSKEEEKRHLKEYKRMMEAALEAERKKAEKERREQEARDKAQNELHRVWDCVVLPGWDREITKPSTRELWWRGIAPRCRGIVWKRAIGNTLAVSGETFRLALKRAKELERSVKDSTTLKGSRERRIYEGIRRDVARTYPELKIFQEGAPLYEPLIDVLFAYSTYRSDIGYVHGIHSVAALFLLNLSPVDSFVALANILNRAIPLAFLTSDAVTMQKIYNDTSNLLSYKLPALHSHLTHQLQLPPVAYLEPLFATLFTFRVPIDTVSRIWDVYVFEGDTFLGRAAVGMLMSLEQRLYGTREDVLNELGWKGIDAGTWKLSADEDAVMSDVRNAGKIDDMDV